MLDEKIMDELIKKCMKDPNLRKIFESFLETSQQAAMAGMKVEEMASICMMGYAIGKDPSLQDMVKNITKITNLGLDIIDK